MPPCIYVDESIHERFGFIVTAFFFADQSVEEGIAEELRQHGLVPGVDEFKSSSVMQGQPELQKLRNNLKRLVTTSECQVGWLVSAAARRAKLGQEIITTLSNIGDSNKLDLSNTTTFVDQGIVQAPLKTGCGNVVFKQDSKKILGLQVADLLASLGSYVLLEEMNGPRKHVNPYDDDVEAPLGWTFKMQLRQNLWRNHPEFTGDNFEEWFSAQLLGFGVFRGDDLPDDVAKAVEDVFGSVYLGCTR